MQKPKLTKRQEQAIKTKNKIYKTAIILMDKNGFNNITIEDISKKAGVSVGAFYHYFKSKNDIFNEIYLRADEYFMDQVACEMKEGNALELIVEYFRHYAIFNLSTGIETVQQLYNTQNKLFIKKGRYMQMLLQQIIESGQEKGELSSEMNPEEISDFLFISVRGLVYYWCLHDGSLNLEEIMTQYVKRLILIFKPILL